MELGTLDFTGQNKADQLALISQVFHQSCVGKLVVRRDGTIALANQYLANKLNCHETIFDSITIEDLVNPKEQDEQVEAHPSLFNSWFKFPHRMTIQKRKLMQIWGWNEKGTQRIPHECYVQIVPITHRPQGMMIDIEGKTRKVLMAAAVIVFAEDFNITTK